jgi:hypothetical protein
MIFLVVFIYDQIKTLFCSNKEGFDATSDVKAAINELYKGDVEAIRNLSSIATKLMTGGLTVPGNLLLPSGGELDLGSNDTTRETNAGKIAYNKFGDNLSIVGKGTPGEARRIRLWDNVEVASNLSVGNTLSAGNLITNTINTSNNPVYLAGVGDGNHFIGLTGGSRPFTDSGRNGPAVVGWDGGVLGTSSKGLKSTLIWDDNSNVSIRGGLRTGGGIGAFCIDLGGKPVPIFASTKAFTIFAMNDIDDAYVVFPGYKIEIFSSENYRNDGDANNNNPLNTFDNTDGFKPIYKALPNTINSGTSCKLYYLGNEVIIDGIS